MHRSPLSVLKECPKCKIYTTIALDVSFDSMVTATQPVVFCPQCVSAGKKLKMLSQQKGQRSSWCCHVSTSANFVHLGIKYSF